MRGTQKGGGVVLGGEEVNFGSVIKYFYKVVMEMPV